MKTRHFFYGALAAMMLFTTSCQEDENLLGNAGETTTVSFKIGTPEIVNRSYSDGTTATHLQYAVYDAQGDILDELTVTDGTIKLNTTVNLQLTTGNTYSVLFWAAAPNAPYTVDLTNKSMTVDYTNAVSNDENRDAFYKYQTFTVTSGMSPVDIKLTRPFAQLNIGTNDIEASKKAGYDVTQSWVAVPVYTTLNLATGDVASQQLRKFDLNNIPTSETFPIAGYKYLAMNYLLVSADKEVVDLQFAYTNGSDEKTRTVGSVPVQRNHRTNIFGQLLTSSVDVNVTIEPDYLDESADTTVVVVRTNEQLENAVKKNDKIIRIVLADNVSLNASNAYLQLGGAETDSIIIDGAGIVAGEGNRTLTLSTTYWSRLNTVNPDATIIIRNAKLTSTQKTGTWNSYDVTFQSNVQLENVVLEKALALDNKGKTSVLKNVTINETHDYYALWISAAGQTVEIDGLTINSAGRGIKIDEQYVNENVAKVTLDVKNATFTTAKKAAIMVKSTAGADITLENVNIDNVAADNVNAVWVDADAPATFDLVNVTGGSKILEGAITIEGKADFYTSISDALAAAADGDIINIPAGEFVIPTKMTTATPGTITFKGMGKSSVMQFNKTPGGADGGLNSYADGMTLIFDNINVVSPNTGSSYTGGFGRIVLAEFNNCTYTGQFRNMGAVKFTNCTIDPQNSYIYTDYGNADFEGCTFNASKGKAIQVYNDNNKSNTTINISNCTFTAAEVGYTWDSKPVTAIDINSNGEKFTVNINNTTANGFGKGLFSENTLWNIKGGEQYVTINIDGNLAYPYYTYDDATQTYSIGSVDGMKWFAKELNVNKNSFSGKTIQLTGDIDLDGVDWEPIGQTGNCGFLGTFDGNNNTIYNLNVDSEAETGDHYSSGLFGWVEVHGSYGTSGVIKNLTVDGATIKGHHNCAVIAGYLIGTVENCHVLNANVSCTYANSEASGDKAGSIAGILAEHNGYIKDCTAKDVTISAGRDAGQIVGAALNGFDSNVTGCSVVNVTVSANGTGTGKNIRNEIVGRLN